MDKFLLLSHIRDLLHEKVASLQVDIAATLHARNADTKSSAGDKHEVGRAMVQQELDQQEAQLAKLQAQLQELARVPLERTSDRAGSGSLVTTDQERYFIAIGMGYVELGGERCAVISPASPIGQALIGKRVGDAISLLGRSFTVRAIG